MTARSGASPQISRPLLSAHKGCQGWQLTMFTLGTHSPPGLLITQSVSTLHSLEIYRRCTAASSIAEWQRSVTSRADATKYAGRPKSKQNRCTLGMRTTIYHTQRFWHFLAPLCSAGPGAFALPLSVSHIQHGSRSTESARVRAHIYIYIYTLIYRYMCVSKSQCPRRSTVRRTWRSRGVAAAIKIIYILISTVQRAVQCVVHVCRTARRSETERAKHKSSWRILFSCLAASPQLYVLCFGAYNCPVPEPGAEALAECRHCRLFCMRVWCSRAHAELSSGEQLPRAERLFCVPSSRAPV